MFDRIDPRSPTPLYAQIAGRIRVAIASGELRSGAALPSVRDLAGRLRVNPATIGQAYRELETEGFVEIRHGAGTYVRELTSGRRTRERARQAKTLVERLLADARRVGVPIDELREAIEGALGARTT
jgi:GntR family transcriptional regulator